ncbi:MAG: 2'-5' RNA ligase family protein [Sandarakinorhabdus sp.]|nr:2'-5' RNA ligase family protein [Sandarakinorhabdus sp.]
MAGDPRPLILTALLAAPAQARFEALRRANYPPEINRVPAHVSLFHHLPGRELAAVKRRLVAVCGPLPPPQIAVTGLKSLGNGVAFQLRSPELDSVRGELADGWSTLLIPQDRAGFRGHVTVQNKVSGAEAKATLQGLQAGFVAFETTAVAVAIWRYVGGPWEALGAVAFRGR